MNMMTLSIGRVLAYSLLVVGISACGWQLRGATPVSTAQGQEEPSAARSGATAPAAKTPTISNNDTNSLPTPIFTPSSNEQQATKEDTPSPKINPNTVSLSFSSPSPAIETALLWVMEQQQIKLANNAARRVIIYRERTEKRPLVYSETGVPLRYQLIMNVDYAVEDHTGSLVVPRRNIMRWRNYDFDATQIAATVQEEKILRSELSGELARQIITAQ